MKKYSICSSIIFIILTIIFFSIEREEEKIEIYSKEKIEKLISADWLLKTSKGDIISPEEIFLKPENDFIVGKSIWNDDIVYLQDKSSDKEEIFIKGITASEVSYLFIFCLMGLQFFILIGLNSIKEHLFLNFYCIFLMILQALYMLRVWLF